MDVESMPRYFAESSTFMTWLHSHSSMESIGFGAFRNCIVIFSKGTVELRGTIRSYLLFGLFGTYLVSAELYSPRVDGIA
ncbi:MAG: hypothetical protein AVO34_13205 [Firmicutes bacterium ML8_F2]|nr:MAG: hypothetical protein AVO34_13205 [Firmicutes bacterium ML8_F2]